MLEVAITNNSNHLTQHPVFCRLFLVYPAQNVIFLLVTPREKNGWEMLSICKETKFKSENNGVSWKKSSKDRLDALEFAKDIL